MRSNNQDTVSNIKCIKIFRCSHLKRISHCFSKTTVEKETNRQHLSFKDISCHQYPPGPEVIKLFSCSNQLSIIILLTNTIVILIFVSLIDFMLNSTEHETSFEPDYLNSYEWFKFHAQLS